MIQCEVETNQIIKKHLWWKCKIFSILGHLTSSDINIPSEHIARCITKFLICSDSQSGMELTNSRNNCYQEFQSCSGSKIEITEGR